MTEVTVKLSCLLLSCLILDSPSKGSIYDDELTESQQKDIEELAALIIDENSDRLPSSDEKEQSEEFEKTWFPSSGFCVRKDMHEIGVHKYSKFKYRIISEEHSFELGA